MQWFRMYSEFASDPKVQSMDETLQRRFVMLLCLNCSGELEQLTHDELAFALRLTPEVLHETLAVFKSKGFLDAEGKIRNWNKRQYKSDTSTERVRKHRQDKVKRTGNVSATPSDTESDSDTESEGRKMVPSEPVAQRRDDAPADRIFEHWRAEFRHPKASLDPKRRRAIQRALQHYDEPTLCQAISGYKLSPHHMGQNDQRTIYDDISLFLRDAEHIDRGLAFARAPPVAAKSAVEIARERLRQSVSGNGRVVSEQ